jgi:hypothetical protein
VAAIDPVIKDGIELIPSSTADSIIGAVFNLFPGPSSPVNYSQKRENVDNKNIEGENQ